MTSGVFRDLIGKKFSKLTVIKRLENIRPVTWICQCECGNETTALSGSLNSGHTKSCGCLLRASEDLSGQKFGMLLAIERAKIDKPGVYWSCLCDCGGTTIASTSHLKSGFKSTCGCSRKPYGDLVGKKFGKLTVISEVPLPEWAKKKEKYWLCVCDCGNEVIDTTSHIGSGHRTTCGCSKNNSGPNHPQWSGVGQISGKMFNRFKRNAKKRGFDFNITAEQLWELFLQQDRKCALTGLLLEFKIFDGGNGSTASLDRKDSTKDYTIDNIQWIHKDLNFMKSDYDEEYFIEMCCKVAEHTRGKSENSTARGI